MEIFKWYDTLVKAENKHAALKQLREKYGSYVWEENPKLREITVFEGPYTLVSCGEEKEYDKETFIAIATVDENGILVEGY